MTKRDILNQCSIELNNVVKLPNMQLDRKIYLEVAKALELIGGKWNRKVQGFVFSTDPSDLLEQISDGTQINLKKQYQFFETPSEIADRLVDLAQIEDHHFTLEPSAGQGAIVKAIIRKIPGKPIDCCEIWSLNRLVLNKIPNVIMVCNDFLNLTADGCYDRIVANPPFSNNQDIDHVMHMYDCLCPGGKLVSVVSKHWTFSTNTKETKFKEWLDEVGAIRYEIERGAFKTSGTTIETMILVIDKPCDK